MAATVSWSIVSCCNFSRFLPNHHRTLAQPKLVLFINGSDNDSDDDAVANGTDCGAFRLWQAVPGVHEPGNSGAAYQPLQACLAWS